ncbi:MAG: hypothetical protein J7J46_04165 [Candidatus Desulfofervidus sp.]|nr:hypothetical protein [Candidatus Desulfofervidus sp.]
MTNISKYIKLEKPEHGWYKAEDWKKGLAFRVMFSDSDKALFLVRGEEAAIAEYLKRFGTRAKELTDAEMQVEMDLVRPTRTETCPECDGTGKIEIPQFDPVKTKTEVEPELDTNILRLKEKTV